MEAIKWTVFEMEDLARTAEQIKVYYDVDGERTPYLAKVVRRTDGRYHLTGIDEADNTEWTEPLDPDDECYRLAPPAEHKFSAIVNMGVHPDDQDEYLKGERAAADVRPVVEVEWFVPPEAPDKPPTTERTWELYADLKRDAAEHTENCWRRFVGQPAVPAGCIPVANKLQRSDPDAWKLSLLFDAVKHDRDRIGEAAFTALATQLKDAMEAMM